MTDYERGYRAGIETALDLLRPEYPDAVRTLGLRLEQHHIKMEIPAEVSALADSLEKS